MPITPEQEVSHLTPESYVGTWWYFAGPAQAQILQVVEVTTYGNDQEDGDSVIVPVLHFKPVEWHRTRLPLSSAHERVVGAVSLFDLRSSLHGLTYLDSGEVITYLLQVGAEVLDRDGVNRGVITQVDLPFISLQMAVDDGPVEDGRILMVNLYEFLNEWGPFVRENSDYQPPLIPIRDSELSDSFSVVVPGYEPLPRSRFERIEE